MIPVLAKRAVAFSVAALIPVAASARDLSALANSVVRVVNYSQRGDWASPWNASGVVESSGSGFVIEGKLVMTNAHVVSDARMLSIHLEGDPSPHEAEVVHIGHDCDLALIRPLDPAVLEHVPPLAFGGLPKLASVVETLGYPVGGLRVSSTRGTVSRIEEQVYVHSAADRHVAVQTDAAINPGSSGGPVIQNGRVVGVAFQVNLELQNQGFFIPDEVIQRFLQDVADGRYDGYPDLGCETVNLENPAARAAAGMDAGESGVRVVRLVRGSNADGRIRVGDVILAVQGHSVANDGSVADGHRRIPFGLLIDRMSVGRAAEVRLLRDGVRSEVTVPLLQQSFWDSRRISYDRQPRYFVYGGLVFVPLSWELLGTYGKDWRRVAPRTLLDVFLYRSTAARDVELDERVVLLRRLEDPVNADMAWYVEQVVERVNGRLIRSLDSLIDAFENHEGDQDVIEFVHVRRFAVLDRRRVKAANPAILERYGIQRDRNP